ncbi:tyrosine-type recombinase/integrase [Polaribacter cellanae]|uniref:Tyrosine-type recombinase/integrase n=1 Tax=Polaribacter cellanae TaxID=2818493 RepID=A0A975CJR2_9FLAO|nr:tyrosine-type recombinase/integrase [Polaribacter cellanae]QTE21160.1 tyrosine-type recombinase/integrase [Polaribacter cellanae]QTE21166.1 tyrosine-type recombinase/integrase [Polaribacter cellanae]QTE21171.1 tyrosine-type recombinase/integrase [Polaribacter cellanae]QTE21202.1 tyrosine-type recombinase/integrase [Polaribacter cellanae]
MNDYRSYLQKESYGLTTIESYTKGAENFVKWCKRNHTTPDLIDYKTFLKYIKYLQRKNTTKKTIKHKIGTLKIYFKYLLSENYRIDNPIENINIKGVKRTINYNVLEADELEDLYYSYETENIKDSYHKLTAKRNKIIVGLLVYQGLNTSELIKLEIQDLQLYKGKIYIKSGARSNARTLELKSWQVIELLEYVKEIREEIKLKWNMENERLFIPNNARLGNTIQFILKKLKKINHKVNNGNQIRASVITNWLKQYNLRQVQVLAGHRYISSTERYLQDDLESLHEIVNNFHPIS